MRASYMCLALEYTCGSAASILCISECMKPLYGGMLDELGAHTKTHPHLKPVAQAATDPTMRLPSTLCDSEGEVGHP